jgi:transmembrane sensor
MGMNSLSDDMLRDDARAWAIRVGDPAFADWEGFSAWLEADPARNPAYEAALDELDAANGLFDVPPAAASIVLQTSSMRSRGPGIAARWRAPVMAACVAVLTVGGGWFALDRSAAQEYVTAPGQRRSIELVDGSRIILNGGTRLTMENSNPRAVTMTNGEALFQIRHDPEAPFVVTTPDGTRLVDVGTTFNVIEEKGALSVEVAEGAVVYRSEGAEMRLDAGEMLTRATAAAEPTKQTVDTETIGAWRTGYLQFSDTPLPELAADLSRNLGVAVAIDRRLEARRFTGTILADGGSDAVMARVGPLLDVQLERRGDGWMMIPNNGARR